MAIKEKKNILSRDYLENIIHFMSETLFVISPQGAITMANQALCDLLGYEKEELVGEPASKIMEWDESLEGKNIDGFFHPGLSRNIEVSYHSKAGLKIPVLFSTSEMRDGHGNNQGLVCVAREISERKQAEERLKESEERFRQIAENIREVFYVLSLNENKILYISSGYEEIWGCSCESLYKDPHSWANSIHLDDQERIKTSYDKMAVGGFNEEYRILQPDGTLRWIRDRSFPVFDQSGRIYRHVGIAEDITEIKRADQALRQSEEQLRLITDSLPTLIAYVDSGERYRFNNKAYEDWFQHSRDEIFGKSIREVLGKGAYELIKKHARNALSGKKVSFDTLLPYQKGGTRFVHATYVPYFEGEGKTKGFFVLVEDLTHKKRAEKEKEEIQAQLLQAQKLEAIGSLAAGVAHEINNPINSIINYAQLLKDDYKEGTEGENISGRIVKEGERIENIVSSLLSFARVDKEKSLPVRLHEIISGSLALAKTQIRKDSIILKVDVPSDLPKILASPNNIQQVFLNIINNAQYALNSKYAGSNEGKILKIMGEEVAINNRSHARITFYDQGTGIPSDILEKITDPFFSTKPKSKGSGLGLSISHGIITNHGGRITFESSEGEFTKVMIDLPVT